MKKLNNPVLIGAVLLLVTTTSLLSQSISQYYTAMPDILNPVLSKKQRWELLEYYKAEMGDSIENRFGNQSHIVSLDTINNHILVQNTGISTFEMMLFENGGDTLIGIIKTVCAPICQSSIDFYNPQWQKRPDIKFNFPKANDWVCIEKLNEAGLTQENVRNALNTSFISLAFKRETNEITAKNNSLEFLDKENREKLAAVVDEKDFVYQLERGEWVKTP